MAVIEPEELRALAALFQMSFQEVVDAMAISYQALPAESDTTFSAAKVLAPRRRR